MALVENLASPRVLWATFLATLVMTALFQIATAVWDLVLLDAIADPAEVRAALATMSAEQRIVHAWLTATLDVAYPLAYGALFIGSAWRFFPSVARYLMWPTLVLVPVDLVEGVIQVAALLDMTDWLDAKALVTPLKTGLFLFGIATTVAGWLAWLVRRVSRSRS